MFELGGHPLVLREGELQLSRGESPRDTALVLSRMVHAIADPDRAAQRPSKSWPSTRRSR